MCRTDGGDRRFYVGTKIDKWRLRDVEMFSVYFRLYGIRYTVSITILLYDGLKVRDR